MLGRKRVFLIALGGFLVMSALGGTATDGGLLIASRIVKGIAAGFTAPAGLSIILNTFREGPPRHKAMAVYSSTGAAGFTFGLIAGGLLSEASWRLVFFMPSIIALPTLLLAARLIPRDEPGAARRQWVDIPGAVTVTAAMLLIVYTLTEAPGTGWITARTIGSFAGVAALLAVFVLIEARQAQPLLPLNLFRSWTRTRANISLLTYFGGWSATALDMLDLTPGQTVAVTGAAGAVGGCAVQLAKAYGLRVIADAAPSDERLVKELGADVVLPRGDDFPQRVRAAVTGGVDGLVDAALLNRLALAAVRDGGRIATLRFFPTLGNAASPSIRFWSPNMPVSR